MNTQPEALRLADWLENEPGYDWNRNYCLAVAELRRLHEENEALRQALAQPKQKYDYRVKYDRPCYKCRSNFCPGNCKEPKYLAQPEQEPVAYYFTNSSNKRGVSLHKETEEWQPLYTAPPKREWVGLTDEEIIDVLHPLVMADMSDEATDYEISRAIEAKLKEKNHD